MDSDKLTPHKLRPDAANYKDLGRSPTQTCEDGMAETARWPLMEGDESGEWGEQAPRDESRGSRARRIYKSVISVRSLLDSVLVVAILALLLDKTHKRNTLAPEQGQRKNVELAGDITGFSPRFSLRVVTFKPDHEFVPDNPAAFFTDEVHNKWLSIVPKGLGYVQISDLSQYQNLPTPLKNYTKHTFTTSVTHQLHCLHSIASTLSAMAANVSDQKENNEGLWHLGHCVDYLRQTIMCAADIALEGQQTTFPKGIDGSDGWDAKHVCRDYTEVMEHLEKESADDTAWI